MNHIIAIRWASRPLTDDLQMEGSQGSDGGQVIMKEMSVSRGVVARWLRRSGGQRFAACSINGIHLWRRWVTLEADG